MPFVRNLVALSLLASAAPIVARDCPVPTAEEGGPVNRHTRYLETHMLPAVIGPDTRPSTLSERMRAFGVPGVSVAVVHKGRIAWARGWGVRDVDTCRPVNAATAFQAASISKAVTAMVALRMVEAGRIGLDDDINRSLSSWHLPADRTLAPNGVTLRQLLSHTAGLGVHGFSGYLPGAEIPTAVEVLNGLAPANTPAVRNVLPAGGQWQYSGGGYVVAQTALGDVSKRAFADLAEQEVLKPLGMRRSGYAQPPPPRLWANAASGHSAGRVIPGRYHVYPELAPAGLWTTAHDLAAFLIDVQKAAAGRTGNRLSPGMARTMLTEVKGNWGLGPALYGEGTGRRFGHDGVNEGFQSIMVAYAARGDGIVVLTNGDQGRRLADEIVRAVATDYGWTELAAPATVELRLSPEQIAKIAGRYEGNGLSVYLDARDDGLFAQTGGPRPERLVAISPLRFRTDASGMLVEFSPGYARFRILEGGPPIEFARIDAKARSAAAVYLRGSMNDWSTSILFQRQKDGSLTADAAVESGELQFKIGSADWREVDFGSSDGALAKVGGSAAALVPHGGNVRVAIQRPGRYRFTVRMDNEKAALTIRQAE